MLWWCAPSLAFLDFPGDSQGTAGRGALCRQSRSAPLLLFKRSTLCDYLSQDINQTSHECIANTLLYFRQQREHEKRQRLLLDSVPDDQPSLAQASLGRNKGVRNLGEKAENWRQFTKSLTNTPSCPISVYCPFHSSSAHKQEFRLQANGSQVSRD